MKKLVKTWLLQTKDGEDVYTDPKGNYTLENVGSNVGVEFREGEHPDDDKEIFGKKISGILGVECHWVQGPTWTEDQVYG
jgi:hypothetical protein